MCICRCVIVAGVAALSCFTHAGCGGNGSSSRRSERGGGRGNIQIDFNSPAGGGKISTGDGFSGALYNQFSRVIGLVPDPASKAYYSDKVVDTQNGWTTFWTVVPGGPGAWCPVVRYNVLFNAYPPPRDWYNTIVSKNVAPTRTNFHDTIANLWSKDDEALLMDFFVNKLGGIELFQRNHYAEFRASCCNFGCDRNIRERLFTNDTPRLPLNLAVRPDVVIWDTYFGLMTGLIEKKDVHSNYFKFDLPKEIVDKLKSTLSKFDSTEGVVDMFRTPKSQVPNKPHLYEFVHVTTSDNQCNSIQYYVGYSGPAYPSFDWLNMIREYNLRDDAEFARSDQTAAKIDMTMQSIYRSFMKWKLEKCHGGGRQEEREAAFGYLYWK